MVVPGGVRLQEKPSTCSAACSGRNFPPTMKLRRTNPQMAVPWEHCTGAWSEIPGTLGCCVLNVPWERCANTLLQRTFPWLLGSGHREASPSQGLKGSLRARGGPGTTVPSALPCPGSIYIGLRNPKEALQRHEKATSWTSFIPTALIQNTGQWPVLGKHSLLNATSRAGLKLSRLGQPACAVPIYSFPYGMPGARQPLCPSYGVYTFP